MEQVDLIEESTFCVDLMNNFDSYRGEWEPDSYFYDPYEWEVSVFDDMCEPMKYSEINYDGIYYDETTWEELDPKHVAEAEAEEMKRFRDRHVCSYMDRAEAMKDREGKLGGYV